MGQAETAGRAKAGRPPQPGRSLSREDGGHRGAANDDRPRDPVEVSLGAEDGLSKPCVVNCDSLLTIPKTYLESRIVRLSERKIEEIHKAIRFAVDMEPLK